MTVRRAVRMSAAGSLAAAVLAVAGCGGNIGNPIQALTGEIAPPDEFQVMAHKPLQMPVSAELPEPRPGAPSPLDPDPHRDARAALLGTSGAQVVPAAAAPSPGEQVLLTSADAAAASSEIRVQLESERIAAEANKPYSPPSLGELLSGGSEKKVDESEALDPVAESQRLQREGLQSPSDPQAVAAVPESGQTTGPSTNYPTGRPQSPIKVPGTGTAY